MWYKNGFRTKIISSLLTLALIIPFLQACGNSPAATTAAQPNVSSNKPSVNQKAAVSQNDSPFTSGAVDIILTRAKGEPYKYTDPSNPSAPMKSVQFQLKMERDLRVLDGSAPTQQMIKTLGGTPVSGDEGDHLQTGKLGICGGYALRELLSYCGNLTPKAGWGIDPGEVYNKLFDSGLISSQTKAQENDLVFWRLGSGVIKHAAIVSSVKSGVEVRNKDEHSLVFTAPLDAAYYQDDTSWIKSIQDAFSQVTIKSGLTNKWDWKSGHGVPLNFFRLTEPKENVFMMVDTSKSGVKGGNPPYLQNVKVVVNTSNIPSNAKSLLITATGQGILSNQPFRKGCEITNRVEQDLILPLGNKVIKVEVKDVSVKDAENFGTGTTLASSDSSVTLDDQNFFQPKLITFSLDIPKPTETNTSPLKGYIYLGTAPYQAEDKMNHGLFEINAANGQFRQISFRAIDGIAVSQDDSTIAAGMMSEKGTVTGEPQMAFYNLKDPSKTIPSVFVLKPTDNGPAQLTGPTWSPDGKMMVVSKVGDLFLYDLDKKKGSRTIGPGWESSWSPVDNRLIVAHNGLELYTSALKGAFNVDPWDETPNLIQSAKAGAVTTLTGIPADANYPRWSPDGNNLVFVSQKSIWVVSAGGGSPRRVSPEGWKATAPVFSPNGQYIAFVRSETEPNGGIWAVDAADGGNPRQVVKTTLANIWKAHLDWAPHQSGPVTVPSSPPVSKATPTPTPSPTPTPTPASSPVVRNTITNLKVILNKLGQGDKPGTISYEIDAVVTATVKDQPAVTATCVSSVNSIPVSSNILYPGETVTIAMQRADLTPGQVVQVTCSLSPAGNVMTGSVTAPR